MNRRSLLPAVNYPIPIAPRGNTMQDMSVLIVDDDSDFRNMMADSIEQYFPVRQAADGASALAIQQQTPADIALLDVNMPGMNGYELCSKLLQLDPAIRVIFVSGDHTLPAQMAAYDAGADDFIAKPFRMAELILKLRRMQDIISNAKALRESLQQANDVAMLALNSSGEMGCVLDFTRHLSQSHAIEPLLKSLVSATASGFDLRVSAQIRADGTQKTLDSRGRANPLEAEILRSLSQDDNRIYSMGKRLILNYPRITLQVKDMPVADPDRCGRLRDHLALLVDAAEQRLDGILLDQRLRQQQAQMQAAMVATRQAIAELEAEYRRQASESIGIFDHMKTELEQAMVYLGLTERQERTVMQAVERGATAASTLYDQGLALDSKFAGILETLGNLPATDTAAPATPDNRHDGAIILF